MSRPRSGPEQALPQPFCGHGRLHRRDRGGVHHVRRAHGHTLPPFTSWHPPWGPFTLVLTAGAIWLTTRGVKLSTACGGRGRAGAGGDHGRGLRACPGRPARPSFGLPFSWAHLTGGLTGLSAGFPLALFMFIGWENGLALAEECPKSEAHHPEGPVHLGWRLRPPCWSSSPMRPSPASSTTYLQSGARRCRS